MTKSRVRYIERAFKFAAQFSVNSSLALAGLKLLGWQNSSRIDVFDSANHVFEQCGHVLVRDGGNNRDDSVRLQSLPSQQLLYESLFFKLLQITIRDEAIGIDLGEFWLALHEWIDDGLHCCG